MTCARNAWQRLGAMPPEEAMQKYIMIVSELYPTWASGSSMVSFSQFIFSFVFLGFCV